MNYKIKGAIRRNRTNFIIYIIIWLILAIVLVSAFSYASHVSNVDGVFDMGIFFGKFAESLSNPFGTMGQIFTEGAQETYFSSLLVVTIVYTIFFFIGFVRSTPKNEFSDIEHGSSDWSQRGEQYRILDKNKGIVLAENNYLPIDKPGNVNVLVVGRIRSW